MVSAAALLAGIAIAADDEASPLHKVMEKVQAKNTVITKGVRKEADYAKKHKDIVAAAEDLVKLGKEAKDLTDVAKSNKEVKEPVEEWKKLTDDFIKEADTFAKLVANAGTKQPKAKDAFKAVTKTCTACHDVFRKEE
jgi:cytochrome c556